MDMRHHDDFSDLLGGTPEIERAAAAGPRNGSKIRQEVIPDKDNTADAPPPQQGGDHDDLLGGETFPADSRIWTAWREEEVKGRVTKVPYRSTGSKSRANDPAAWITRADAKRVASRLQTEGRKGVGVFLGGAQDIRMGGVDLDSCYDPVSNTMEPWAQEVIERFASYAEISPSGTGVKVFFHYAADDLEPLRAVMGKLWGNSWSRGSHLEIALHLGNRYFTVTDLHCIGTPRELRPVDRATLLWLIEEAGPAFKGHTQGKTPEAKGRDDSRSGRAFKIAGECRRQGLDIDGFRAELRKDPDLAEWAKDDRQVRRAWDNTLPQHDHAEDCDEVPDDDISGVNILGFPMTEDGVARAFTAVHADRLRYCHSSARWHIWTGTHWRKEETKLAFNWARETARQRASADPLSKDVWWTAKPSRSRCGRAPPALWSKPAA